ncbi:hypothetical protein [Marixanthomonas ophiurae]|uniref:Uncharacterized protein n=1 Tax=Marixanthomonas ophiurae TaxID=387659 RepID=A0A3E1Q708_9FLAO|nr:hypothetical protein [Marixanthomonas ophiurae]RFN57911.1 hypothetical protein DZ858_11750 [Marixanthomonas ophiurae]
MLLVEAMAAVAGLILIRNRKTDKATKYFVYFLCFTILLEITGNYAPVAYYSGYKLFSFVEGTVFENNYWLYNINLIISYTIYISYFKWHLDNLGLRKFLNVILVLFIITSTLNLLFSDVYFVAFSAFTNVVGTVLVLLAISLYYYELLNSDAILKFDKSLPFYISLGAILLHLVLTPIFIYSRYFSLSESPEFVELYKTILLFTILLVYLLYTIGFFICLKKKGFS